MSTGFRHVRGATPAQLSAAVRVRVEQAQRATEADIAGTARRMVHRRTGRTEGSLTVHMTDALRGQLTGHFGAVWEVARGGDHDFVTRALQEVGPRAKARLRAALNEAKRG